ncbi:hypothetical protein Cgig2_016253 [Carnegiea gigantea]|uniref:Uncharacterized protein n=1 Tax=Carnegiea gigantea TaxID=171969 RepID=A0A9Q1KHD9_9CARY|nr:hypothetical protein Cgig2_016253 [Carnegiea gigantea]
MATVSDRRTSDGTIVRRRRVPVASRTPYAPPEKLPKPERAPIEEDHENPNWLSGLIYPAKTIASSAGKLLSFFDPGSSSFSSDAESSENDDEEDEVENDVSFLQHGRSDKVLSSSSKTEKKRKIEQLVVQETFSREEGSELIKLIKSRLVDANENSDESAANMRTTAIMEARKWLQQKRFGSKEKVENELDATNLATPYQATRNEKGSPVGMAKSYMQNRHAWVSPTLNHSEFGSPSPLGVLHFKEETPRSTLYSSEMKTSSVSSGSWNILEEVRRVRSKATEELLAATPLTKTRMSSFSPEAPADATHDRLQNVLLDASTILPSRINQVSDAVQSMEPHECPQDAGNIADTICYRDFLAGGQDATLSPRPSDGNTGGSSQAGPYVHVEDPQANPPNDVINGAQNSSSIELEELFQEPSEPIQEQTSKTIAKDSRRERVQKRVHTERQGKE